MVSTDSHRLNQVIRLAPPDDAPENPRYIRYAVLWLRARDPTAVLQRHLGQVHAAIADAMTGDSPQAFTAAAERANQFATAALDVAQLQVFAAYIYRRLLALGS